MRVLLAHNSLYFPAYGGGDKSNRLLMERLAERGHSVQVVARLEDFGENSHLSFVQELATRNVQTAVHHRGVNFELNGVNVRVLTRDGRLRSFLSDHVQAFDPDVILTSTDDPAHLLFETALNAERARVVFLIRAIIALPFGPSSSLADETRSEKLQQADGAVGVSEYVAEYSRVWGGLDAVHVPISLLDPGQPPRMGGSARRYISMVNPCAVKGIDIFLGLADKFSEISFAAVSSWGTTRQDLEALRRRPNITILPPLDDIDDLFRDTRIALVPSLWAEARSRIILEAMSRGIPVIASDVGGLREAKLGVDYLLPVSPVTRYGRAVDELMVPVAEIPPQDIGPWSNAIRRLLNDPEHYSTLATQSRVAALDYGRDLSVLPFERYLAGLLERPRKNRVQAGREHPTLSPERQKLLTARLRKARERQDQTFYK